MSAASNVIAFTPRYSEKLIGGAGELYARVLAAKAAEAALMGFHVERLSRDGALDYFRISDIESGKVRRKRINLINMNSFLEYERDKIAIRLGMRSAFYLRFLSDALSGDTSDLKPVDRKAVLYFRAMVLKERVKVSE